MIGEQSNSAAARGTTVDPNLELVPTTILQSLDVATDCTDAAKATATCRQKVRGCQIGPVRGVGVQKNQKVFLTCDGFRKTIAAFHMIDIGDTFGDLRRLCFRHN